MCGIAGFLDLSKGRPEDRLAAEARAMADRLTHRGPDDEGVWTKPDAGLALGFRRLAIQDLSADGAQPMTDPSGRFTIVFNGEIYNFQDLRRRLEGEGAGPWRGRSDTEVLLAAVRAWGLMRALEEFDGMFALALWDAESRRLTLARDRMGEKPLYCGWRGQVFLFASELKALHAHPDFSAEIDREAVAGYMRYGYVPAPRSIFAGIEKLPPGAVLTVAADGPAGVGERSVFWDPIAEAEGAEPFEGAPEAAVDRLEQLLKRSIGRRMVADVPLGAFLSGGIDSSCVTALMQELSDRPVKTFSIGFTDPRFDEAPHAKAVAHHLKTEHTELYVDPNAALKLVPKLPEVYDEPFADASALPTMLLCGLTRKHVTTALSGDGGDELFCGYPRYRAAVDKFRGDAPLSPSMVKATPFGPLNLLSSGFGKPGRFGDKLWRKMSDRAAPSLEALYEGYMSRWRIWDRPAADPTEGYFRRGARRPRLDDDLQRLMVADALTYLPDDLLVKIDRASMAASLEARAPLLSADVVRFAWGLPTAMKLRDRTSKWALREVLYRRVPKPLIDRPKAGFEPPLADWLRGPLRDWAQALIAGDRLAADGLIDPEPVRAVWEEHLKGQRNWHFELWTVLMLQSWRETWSV